MPFRRSYARSTRYRRRTTRRVTRRPARRTITRRRPTRNRYNSRRRILNVASKKKSDTMMPTVVDGTNVTPGGYGMPGNITSVFFWNATARDRLSSNNQPTANSVRESDVCYMRGLKERITLRTNTQAAWRWRRVCFTAKGFEGNFGTLYPEQENSNGWMRMLRNYNGTAVLPNLTEYIFKGTQSVDWFDVMNAKVDTNRVTLKYDRTITINSGNDKGKYVNQNLWHPMNKNLVYANDESGEGESNQIVSSLGKAGMGDYYVMDLFSCATGVDADGLLFQPEATLYWHEK